MPTHVLDPGKVGSNLVVLKITFGKKSLCSNIKNDGKLIEED